MKTLVKLQDIKVRRGAFTLDIPSWTLQEGHILGLVGPNAAGKSTLLELLAGFIPVDSGRISVLGKTPVSNVEEVRSQVGFMNDTYPLPNMRIGSLLKMVSGYYKTWDTGLVETLLKRFEVDPGQATHTLSKGQGTRLRLILAMAFQPRLLLLDEPATGLDLAGRRELLRTVLEFVKGPNKSVIISSHMLGDLERIADTLLVLDRGHIVKQGNTQELVGDERTLEEALLLWGAAGTNHSQAA